MNTAHPFDGNDLSDRVTKLNDRSENAAGRYVLCWLQQTLRAHDNPALDAAIALANDRGVPVLVYHGLRADYPHASDRLHRFILGASRDLQRDCAARGVRCVTYVERPGKAERGLVYRLAEHAVAVVSDEQWAFVGRWQLEGFARSCAVAVYGVDASRLVPTRVLPDNLKTTPAFRKASGEHRDHCLDAAFDFDPSADPYDGDLPFDDHANGEADDDALDARMAACAIDHSLPPSPVFRATQAACDVHLAEFIEKGLPTYAARRNNSADEAGVSRLSPYIHFGMVGPRRIARAVRDADVKANARWKFLDELLTWREWFHYLAFQAEIPEAYENLPPSARKTLEAHAGDERDVLYDLDTLLHGRTDDETWNAAQRQWLVEGYMHNNLRMYWGKKLIGWTPDPQSAWITACYINDRLSLDGRDPATYGNMQWCFGRSKPAYRENPVYGWVPPKTDRGIRKRSGANEWLAERASAPVPDIAVPDQAWLATGFDTRLLANG